MAASQPQVRLPWPRGSTGAVAAAAPPAGGRGRGRLGLRRKTSAPRSPTPLPPRWGGRSGGPLHPAPGDQARRRPAAAAGRRSTTHDEKLGVPGQGGVVVPVPDGWLRTDPADARGPLAAARGDTRRRLRRPRPGRRPATDRWPRSSPSARRPLALHPRLTDLEILDQQVRHAARVLHPRRLWRAAGDALGELRRQRHRPRDLGDRPTDRRARPGGAGVQDRHRGLPAGSRDAARRRRASPTAAPSTEPGPETRDIDLVEHAVGGGPLVAADLDPDVSVGRHLAHPLDDHPGTSRRHLGQHRVVADRVADRVSALSHSSWPGSCSGRSSAAITPTKTPSPTSEPAFQPSLRARGQRREIGRPARAASTGRSERGRPRRRHRDRQRAGRVGPRPRGPAARAGG